MAQNSLACCNVRLVLHHCKPAVLGSDRRAADKLSSWPRRAGTRCTRSRVSCRRRRAARASRCFRALRRGAAIWLQKSQADSLCQLPIAVHSSHPLHTLLLVVLQVLYADAFNLHCFQTLTGTKFLMVVKPDTPDVDEVLRTL